MVQHVQELGTTGTGIETWYNKSRYRNLVQQRQEQELSTTGTGTWYNRYRNLVQQEQVQELGTT